MAGERGQWGALVVGTSRSSTGLPALDAVRNNLVALRAALTDPALVAIPSPNVVVVPDPADPGKMLSPLSGLAEAVKDVLIVYFAGHGLLDLKGDLHLATTESSHANARWSAIRANDVRDLLRDAVATTRILILDCCFSGRALEAMGGGPESVIAGTLGVTGTVTIASAPPNATALAPIGATYTAFTGEFLSVITEGDSSVQSEHLDVETVYRLTQSRLIRNGWPRPQMLNQNEGHHIPLCRNVAHPAAGPTLSANADVGSDIGEAASTVRSQTPSPVLRSEWLHIDIPKLPMVNDVAFGPSDGWIAIAAGRTIHYYDVRTRMSRQVAKVGGFLNDVRSVEVSQYGDFLLGMHALGFRYGRWTEACVITTPRFSTLGALRMLTSSARSHAIIASKCSRLRRTAV